MADFYLDVPFVTQLGFGDPSNPRDDPTGCWYSSACMVNYFFEAGPRLGVPALHRSGVGSDSHGNALRGHLPMNDRYTTPRFLRNEKLEGVTEPASGAWTLAELKENLQKYGPLMVSWTKTSNGNTYGHCSVVIGVSNDGPPVVIIHDPENLPKSRHSLDDFNASFMWGFGWGLLRRKGPAYQRTFAPAAPVASPIKPKIAMAAHKAPPKPAASGGGGVASKIKSFFKR